MDIYDSVRNIIANIERVPSTTQEGIAPIGRAAQWSRYTRITVESVVDTVVEACEQEAKRLGIPVVIAIVDASGSLVYQRRMERALGVSRELAPNKAYTAVAFRCGTEKLGAVVQPGTPLYGIETMVKRPIVLFGGGEPLMLENHLIGGLGISGGTVKEDVLIVNAGLRAFQSYIQGA